MIEKTIGEKPNVEQRAAFFAMIDEVQRHTCQVPPEELEADIAEAVSAVKGDN